MSIESRLSQWWKDHPEAKKCYQVLQDFFEHLRDAGSHMRNMNARKIKKHTRVDDIKIK